VTGSLYAYAFIDLEPVQRSDDGCDMRRFRSYNHSTCKFWICRGWFIWHL